MNAAARQRRERPKLRARLIALHITMRLGRIDQALMT